MGAAKNVRSNQPISYNNPTSTTGLRAQEGAQQRGSNFERFLASQAARQGVRRKADVIGMNAGR